MVGRRDILHARVPFGRHLDATWTRGGRWGSPGGNLAHATCQCSLASLPSTEASGLLGKEMRHYERQRDDGVVTAWCKRGARFSKALHVRVRCGFEAASTACAWIWRAVQGCSGSARRGRVGPVGVWKRDRKKARRGR